MKNVFDSTNDVNNNVNLNTFDWQHQNSFTARLGYIYPLFSALVPAKSKFKVKPNLGLQFMPMCFPVQTRMKARVSFFRVPLRTLWSDYQDYVGNFRDDLEEPYLDVKDANFEKFYGECKLGDYLDIPNVVYTSESGNSPILSLAGTFDNFKSGIVLKDGISSPYQVGGVFHTDTSVVDQITSLSPGIVSTYVSYQIQNSIKLVAGATYTIDLSGMPTQLAFEANTFSNGVPYSFDFIACLVDSNSKVLQVINYSNDGKGFFTGSKFGSASKVGYNVQSWNNDFKFTVSPDIDASDITQIIFFWLADFNVESNSGLTLSNLKSLQKAAYGLISGSFLDTFVPTIEGQSSEGTYAIITPSTSPYYSSESNPDGLKLKAYRPRAYESIYNAYLRDNRNNPFYVDGKVQYNKWLPNYEGGADSYPYELHRANWEKDFLTTAVPSPQQGIAPLVGLTSYMAETPASDGNNLALRMALVDESGKKYKVEFNTGQDGVNGQYNVQIGEILPADTPTQPLNFQSLIDTANLGISIPDLRIVNSYQKFLELNMRKGFSYKDIVEGRFDVQIKYDDLLMPEFIGGYTRDVTMNRVVQSIDMNSSLGTSTYAGSLGSLAGDAFLSTNGDVPTISCFCDEESIIMGIMSIVPVPAYSQLLPKDYLYSDLLDHFQPEFNNLGFQPVKYAEICPLQCKSLGVDYNDTFGYQRPWYEYVSKVDTVHGLMRTQLRNFIMNRNFSTVPKLTESFLLVDDEQLTDVFAVTETTDKIIGQCYFDCQVELPVSRVAIPRLD